MTALLGTWLVVSVGIMAVARKLGPWWRVIPGAFIWPTYGILVAVSRLRYKWSRD